MTPQELERRDHERRAGAELTRLSFDDRRAYLRRASDRKAQTERGARQQAIDHHGIQEYLDDNLDDWEER
jgi:hypothetical protein